jgi:hypothetical protein
MLVLSVIAVNDPEELEAEQFSTAENLLTEIRKTYAHIIELKEQQEIPLATLSDDQLLERLKQPTLVYTKVTEEDDFDDDEEFRQLIQVFEVEFNQSLIGWREHTKEWVNLDLTESVDLNQYAYHPVKFPKQNLKKIHKLLEEEILVDQLNPLTESGEWPSGEYFTNDYMDYSEFCQGENILFSNELEITVLSH